MIVYLVNIFLIILSQLNNKVFVIGNQVIDRKKKTCIVFSALWVFISGLRGLTVGEDTRAYGIDYNNIMNTSWNELWNNLILKMSSIENLFAGELINKDPGYKLLVKAISMVVPNYRLFLFVVAILFMSLLGRFLYKHTDNPFLGFVVFDCLFYSFYAITGIRQTIATALIVLLGYDYIKNKKLIHFFLVAFGSFFIHKSAICFIPFYFISRIKINRVTLLMICSTVVTSFCFRYELMNILSISIGYEQYNQQYNTQGPLMFSFLLLSIFLICIFYKKQLMDIDKEFSLKFLALSCALFFLPLAYIDPSAMRVSYYYALFLMVLLPDIVKLFRGYEKIASLGITVVMILLLMSNNPTYVFFWDKT